MALPTQDQAFANRDQALPVTETTPYTDQRGNPTAPQPSALGASPDPGVRRDPPNVTGQSEYTRQHERSGDSPYTKEHLKPEQMALNPDDQQKCDALYEQLKPEATMEARNYVLARTPELYQQEMVAKIEADWPAPEVAGLTEEKARDRDSYKRSADPNPNFDPNLSASQGQGQCSRLAGPATLRRVRRISRPRPTRRPGRTSPVRCRRRTRNTLTTRSAKPERKMNYADGHNSPCRTGRKFVPRTFFGSARCDGSGLRPGSSGWPSRPGSPWSRRASRSGLAGLGCASWQPSAGQRWWGHP